MGYGNWPSSPVAITTVSLPYGDGSTSQYYEGKSCARYGTNNVSRAREPSPRKCHYVVVSRQRTVWKKVRVRSAISGKIIWKKRRVTLNVLRLRKICKRLKQPGGISPYRGAAPNALLYTEVVRSKLPVDLEISGWYRYAPWSVRTSALGAISPMYLGVAQDIHSYAGSGSTFNKHPGYASCVNRLREAATAKIYGRVKDQDFNALQALAEHREAAATLSGLAVNLVRLGLSLKRWKPDLVEDALKELTGDSKKLANSVLGVQYGVRPLVADIQGAMKSLVNLPTQPSYFSVKAKSSEALQPHVVVLEDNGYVYTEIRTTATVEFKLHARLKVNNLLFRNAGRLGLTNLGSLGYELLPYSFVLDWVIPIGEYLNSLDAFAGLEVESVTETIVIKQKTAIVRELKATAFDGNAGSFQINKGYGNVGVSVDCFEVKRNLTSLNLPPYPHFKSPLSGEHLLNAAALIRQLFKK